MLKKIVSRLSTVFLVLLVGYTVLQRAPQILANYKAEGQKVSEAGSVRGLSGEEIQLPRSEKTVLVFWATWCGPCRVELERLNSMIKDGKLSKESVLTIATDRNVNDVQEEMLQREYLFDVVVDVTGSLSSLYGVQMTPTLLLVDANNIVQWKTAGVSPSLEFRILNFLKP